MGKLRLMVVAGPASGRSFEASPGAVIGRGETCQIPIIDESASREHARIEGEPGRLLIRDLGSRNGTRVNGVAIAEPRPLSNGDEVALGATRILVVDEDAQRRETRPGPPPGEVDLVVRSVVRARDVDLVARPVADAHARRLKLLLAIGQAVATQVEEEPLLEAVLSTLVRESGLTRAAFIPLQGGVPDLPAARTSPRSAKADFPSQRVLEKVLGRGEGLLVLDTQEEHGLRERASVVRSGARAIACVPVEAKDRIVGVLYADASERVLQPEDLEVLVEVGRRIGQALVVAGRFERTRDEVRWLRREALGPTPHSQSPAYRQAIEVVEKAAASLAPILFTGETGTGKEVLARYAHRRSGRADGPFVATNCAALPPTLVEAELFGHERGAFTGADRRHSGRFEQADGGTIFLDEIGEIPLEVQAKLLRVVETHEVLRLGAERAIRSDFRLVAATNRDLARMVAEGRFREDLRYRLAVVEIRVPSLRERPEDLPLLAEELLREVAARMGRPTLRLASRSLEALVRYAWPGNVRELRNVLERAAILAPSEEIDLATLPAEISAPAAPPRGEPPPSARGEIPSPARGEPVEPGGPAPARPPARSIADAEREAIREALVAAFGVKARAAEILGISRPTLNKKLKDYGLE